MSIANRPTTAGTRQLLPARLADAQIDHLALMVRFIVHGDADCGSRGIDEGYCERRLRALTETYDLVITQRQRILTLVDLLERHALLRMQGRSAA